jgi:hypothetical protein
LPLLHAQKKNYVCYMPTEALACILYQSTSTRLYQSKFKRFCSSPSKSDSTTDEAWRLPDFRMGNR